MHQNINKLSDRILAGELITESDALALCDVSGTNLHTLFCAASRIKETVFAR